MFSADNLGGILEAALSLNGIVGGATFAIFALGILAPFVESIGATVGLFTGVGVCTWMYIGRNVLPLPTEILEKSKPLPVSTESCIYPNGSTPIIPDNPIPEVIPNSGLKSFYNISVHYIGTLGFSTCLLSALITSAIVYKVRGELSEGGKNAKLHAFLLNKKMFCWIPGFSVNYMIYEIIYRKLLAKLKSFVRCGLVEPEESDSLRKSRRTVSFEDNKEKDFQSNEKNEELNTTAL